MSMQFERIVFTPGHGPVKAFVELLVTVNGTARLCMNSIRIVEPREGAGLIVSMPRNLPNVRCHQCNHRHSVKDNYCPECGEPAARQTPGGADARGIEIFFPVDSASRNGFVGAILKAYHAWADTGKPVVGRRDTRPV